jgi:surface protein
MSYMFYQARSFNNNGSTMDTNGNKWNTISVENMSTMFSEAELFNQDIGNWNTSKVTNMLNMFAGATAFNQDIGNWDTSKVTDMSGMFALTELFNQNIESWNTSIVENMSGMFYEARSFNQQLNNWDTSKVTNMSYMFQGTSSFNQNLGEWKLNSVEDMTKFMVDTSMSPENISETLIGWADNKDIAINVHCDIIDNNGVMNIYSYAFSTYNYLIQEKGWTFSTINVIDLNYIDLKLLPTGTKINFINKINNSSYYKLILPGNYISIYKQ